jgi:hypothetical protein
MTKINNDNDDEIKRSCIPASFIQTVKTETHLVMNSSNVILYVWLSMLYLTHKHNYLQTLQQM